MKKLFLFMIIVLLNIVCFGENEKLKDLELYKFRSGGVVGEGYGGIDYILNAKNSREMLMYFKLNDYSKNSVRVPYYEGINQENKDLLLSEFFDKKNLDLYYSRDFVQLKDGRKFLYGKFISDSYRMNHLQLELYFLDKTSPKQIIFLIYSGGSVFFLLFLSIVIKVNISFIERKLKQLEEMTLPYEFEIHPLKDNSYIFLCIVLFIMFITILYFKLNELLKNFTSKDIFFVIFMIITIAVNFNFFLENLNSLIISGRIIKLLYENNEIEFIEIDNIRYAKFYAANAGKGRKERNPTFQIFDKEEKKFVEISIKPTDYCLLKKYFTKYNVMIDDLYEYF